MSAGPPHDDKSRQRQERLAAELRANLKKRKARARAAPGLPAHDQDAESSAHDATPDASDPPTSR
ncbi:MAG: hypothetical protein KDJ41_15080 [Hyphomicrobiaceae bacterium]|nr:hypothetical protein [Hyphomicrobiaceae bacterium]